MRLAEDDAVASVEVLPDGDDPETADADEGSDAADGDASAGED